MRPMPKDSRFEWPKYLLWQRDQPCAACGCVPVGKAKSIPAHQRILGGGGTAYKPSDTRALPLCHNCHTAEHSGSVTFWELWNKDPARECIKHIERFLIERDGG